jgi:dipeptidyl aminopeptidase/acylaminoacyl peptidase
VTISPDGKNLAFVEGPDKHSKLPHILLLPTDGSQPRVLAEGMINGYWLLQWTPDGESLLFFINGTKELWRASFPTGELSFVSRLPTEPNAGRISPDGRHFSYTLAGYVSEVWALENFLPEVSARR